MKLKFKVGMPERNIRTINGQLSLKRGASVLLLECMETIEATVTVSGLPSTGKGESQLTLNYFEEYDRCTSLGDFEDRAKAFADNYCSIIGLL